MKFRSFWHALFALVAAVILAACTSTPPAGDSCGGCAEGMGCGEDGRCHDACNGDSACDLCSRCSAGLCMPTGAADACACAVDQDCDDGNACTGLERCALRHGVNRCYAGAHFACAPAADACIQNVCQPSVGGVATCVARTRDDPGCICAPETDADLCARLSADCGTLSAADNCGVVRTVQCPGSCAAGEHCEANQCACNVPSDTAPCCVPPTDATLCVNRCGDFLIADSCGLQRVLACGDPCAWPYVCDSGAHACVCIGETEAELCALAAFECGSASLTDRCGVVRPVACGLCAAGSRCGTASACLCDYAGYGGIPSPSLDGNGNYDPASDTLINDVPLLNDAGTWRGCTQNTTTGAFGLEGSCVSVSGRQQHLLGATPNASSILLHRASGTCSVDQFWLYDGTFAPQSYVGTDITAIISGRSFDTTEGKRLTLTPDGLTIIGRTPGGALQALTRAAATPGAAFELTASTAWFGAINALGVISEPTISGDSRFLFFLVAGTPNEIWQATRADATSAFTDPLKLPGTATDQINDGTFSVVTGASDNGHSVFVSKGFATYAFVRPVISDAFVLVNPTMPYATWYAMPILGCGRLLGTLSPGGCGGEGIGYLPYNW